MNNRKSTPGRRVQVVRSEPLKIKTSTFITKDGRRKNKYKINKNSHPIKYIRHI